MQTRLLDDSGAPAQPGTVRAHLGDWRRAWWLWPEECALIMDPPFGQKYKSGMVGHGWAGKNTTTKRTLATGVIGDDTTRERDEALDQPWAVAAVWGPKRVDQILPWGSELAHAEETAKALVAAGHEDAAAWLIDDIRTRFGDRTPPRAILIHDKGAGVGMGDLSFPWKPNYETISIYGKGWSGKRTTSVLAGRVIAFGKGSASNGRTHPNEKPLTVCAELVGKAPAEFEVVDPFAGSFSVPLAAALLGRDCCAAECDPEHYARGVARLRASGVRVLEGPGHQ